MRRRFHHSGNECENLIFGCRHFRKQIAGDLRIYLLRSIEFCFNCDSLTFQLPFKPKQKIKMKIIKSFVSKKRRPFDFFSTNLLVNDFYFYF